MKAKRCEISGGPSAINFEYQLPLLLVYLLLKEGGDMSWKDVRLRHRPIPWYTRWNMISLTPAGKVDGGVQLGTRVKHQRQMSDVEMFLRRETHTRR